MCRIFCCFKPFLFPNRMLSLSFSSSSAFKFLAVAMITMIYPNRPLPLCTSSSSFLSVSFLYVLTVDFIVHFSLLLLFVFFSTDIWYVYFHFLHWPGCCFLRCWNEWLLVTHFICRFFSSVVLFFLVIFLLTQLNKFYIYHHCVAYDMSFHLLLYVVW